MICSEYARRGNFFYKIFLEEAAGDYTFQYDGAHGYEEDLPWMDFVMACPIDSLEFGQVQVVRRMCPINRAA
jgi:hypothetical protein